MRYVEKTGTIFVRANFPEETMAKKCENCGKIPQVGHHVSHSNIKTNRRFNPNLQTVRHQTPEGIPVTRREDNVVEIGDIDFSDSQFL